jgi:ketosteroid isomerase-like protein
MKRIAISVSLVILVFIVAIAETAGTLNAGPEHQKAPVIGWLPEQKDALNAFQQYIEAASRGNFKEMSAFWHPRLVAWDFAEDSPLNYDEFLRVEGEFCKNHKFKKLEFEPLSIQVAGNTAVIHLKYDDVISDPAGKEMSASGHWTAILLKQDSKWVILSNVWKAK